MKPAMTDAEIACYRNHLAQARVVLEYGTGGSTVLAAESAIERLYSVESDPAWLNRVTQHPSVAAMIAAGRANCVHVDLGPVRSWGKPKSRLTLLRWPSYAKRPWMDGYRPDLVLVDGRFRMACLLEAARYNVAKIAVHDFWKAKALRRYRRALPYFDVVDRADTMAILQPRANVHRLLPRALSWFYQYDPR